MTQHTHVMAFIHVCSSLFLQIFVFTRVYVETMNNYIFILFPVYLFLTSFFCFYSVNIIYNIFVPKGWIEQNSKYLCFTKLLFHSGHENNDNINNRKILSISPQKNNFPLHSSFATTKEESQIKKMMKPYFKQIKPKQSKERVIEVKEKEMEKNKENTTTSIMPQLIIIPPHVHFDEEECVPSISSFNNRYITPTSPFRCFSSPSMSSPSPSIDALELVKTIVTIQIPVYTESFEDTLLHTFENALAMCRYFNERHHEEKMNLFINDDGLFCVTEEEKAKRIHYYNINHELFYIARPKENRAGKFKKASNMNYAINEIIANGNNPMLWNDSSKKKGFLFKEDNLGSFQIGDYILLLDSDSRMDETCMESLIFEIKENEDIGFLQIRTNAMIISNKRWEEIIGYFTNVIYDINFLYSCSNGFPAPLVGHNCLLNFNVMKKVEQNNRHLINGLEEYCWKVWDENRVSEDFVMSLQMQFLGYYGKYVYFDCGMYEGVTLNILDEIVKLEKYMYGINEIVFYPITKWKEKGIFTHLFIDFLVCNTIHFSTKYGLLAYLGSYYALSFSPIGSILWSIWYFVSKNNDNQITEYMNNSIETMYSCVLIFFCLSIFSNICVKYKHQLFAKENPWWKNVLIEIYYSFALTFFFISIPYHLLKMILVHFNEWKAEWKTTNKEVVNIGWFYVMKKFKIMYFAGSVIICLIGSFYYVTGNIMFFPLFLTVFFTFGGPFIISLIFV